MEIDNKNVRRHDRTMPQAEAEQLLAHGEYGVLAMAEQRVGSIAPYAVPISYVWDGTDTIYMHCATEGHKLCCLDANPLACFTVVGHTEVNPHDFTTAYESIVIRGMVSRRLADDEKRAALRLILNKYCPDNIEAGIKAIERSLYRTEILRLSIQSATAKRKSIGQKSQTRLKDGV